MFRGRRWRYLSSDDTERSRHVVRQERNMMVMERFAWTRVVTPKASSIDDDWAPATRRGLTEEVTDRLRWAILSGALQPGERAAEADLSRRLTVSRGPIREALVHLEQEGLVVSEWHRGARVVEFSKDDVGKLASLRLALEQVAIVEAVREATQQDFDRLREIIDRMKTMQERGDGEGLVELDIEFHDAIYQAANHERLYAAWTTIRSQVALSLLRRRVVADDYMGLVVPEHTEILAIIRSGREKAARQLIATHLEGAYSRLLAGFDRPSLGQDTSGTRDVEMDHRAGGRGGSETNGSGQRGAGRRPTAKGQA
jgi:DNA-binding GntR family transcriptional regulator